MTASIRPAIGMKTASTMPRQRSESQNASPFDKEKEDVVDAHSIIVVAFVIIVIVVAFVIVIHIVSSHILAVVVVFIDVDMSAPIPSTAAIHATAVRTMVHLGA